jgi:hypothetical protein
MLLATGASTDLEAVLDLLLDQPVSVEREPDSSPSGQVRTPRRQPV